VRLTLIGQAPSRETDGKPPFTGRCGAFLAGLMGTTQERMLEDHEFLNVLDRFPGKGINGDLFPRDKAEIAARGILPSLRGKVVILLGSNVARAFGAKSFTYYEKYEIRDPANRSEIIVPLMVVVPHPSGVVRHWNIPQNREIARKFFAEILAFEKTSKPSILEL
jgi:uracil-DNA glycosylase